VVVGVALGIDQLRAQAADAVPRKTIPSREEHQYANS